MIKSLKYHAEWRNVAEFILSKFATHFYSLYIIIWSKGILQFAKMASETNFFENHYPEGKNALARSDSLTAGAL